MTSENVKTDLHKMSYVHIYIFTFFLSSFLVRMYACILIICDLNVDIFQHTNSTKFTKQHTQLFVTFTSGNWYRFVFGFLSRGVFKSKNSKKRKYNQFLAMCEFRDSSEELRFEVRHTIMYYVFLISCILYIFLNYRHYSNTHTHTKTTPSSICMNVTRDFN